MSTSSIETFTTLAVAGVALLYGYSVYNRASTSPAATQNTQSASADESQNIAPGKKNKKKKKGASSSTAPTPGNATPVVSFPEAIPGSLSLEDISANVSPQAQAPDTTVGVNAAPSSDKTKKQKKKKAVKKATPVLAASSSALDTDFAAPQEPSGSTSTQSQRKRRDSSPHDGQTDASWIHVGTTKKSTRKDKDQQTETESNKSDVSESTPNDTPASEQEKPKDNVRTLAEKILPKPRKTKVDDMLETPDQPTLARVMRVQSGTVGTSSESLPHGDYEDSGTTDVAGADADADGEGDDDDEGGWGVVKSRKPRYTRPAGTTASTISSSQSSITGASASSQTKRQRQNAKRRDEAKATKAQEEEARLARLAQHKRQLEQERIRAQYASGGSANKGKLSGGMRASVDASGHVVWES